MKNLWSISFELSKGDEAMKEPNLLFYFIKVQFSEA